MTQQDYDDLYELDLDGMTNFNITENASIQLVFLKNYKIFKKIKIRPGHHLSRLRRRPVLFFHLFLFMLHQASLLTEVNPEV